MTDVAAGAEAIYKDEVLVVEPHGIEHIKPAERHGTLFSQFAVWFACNMHVTGLVLGALALTVFNLGFWGGITSVLAANLLGALGLAACVAMGPRQGMPQMPISRASFGYFGNYLPSILAWLGYIGWFTVEIILGSQLVQQFTNIPYVPAVIGLSIIIIAIAIYGYNAVHVFEKYMTYVSLAVFLILTGLVLFHGVNFAAPATVSGGTYWENWMIEFTIMFSYTVSWAPYAADYGRYLPENTPLRKPFWYSFLGMFISIQWVNMLGIALASMAIKGGVVPALGVVSGVYVSWLVYITLILGAMTANVLNIYSGGLSALAFDLPLKRWTSALLIGVIGLVLGSLFGGEKFVAFVKDFLFTLVYWVLPWLAIIVVDFFILNDGGRKYPNVLEFYKRRGVFGAVNWRGLVAFFVGLGVSVPFMAAPYFTGPIGNALHGADFSYLISFVIAGIIYWGLGTTSVRTVPTQSAASGANG
ncbi:MAG: purine-cytosine permease family protein [Candidatus Dormibacteraceae bacterium]